MPSTLEQREDRRGALEKLGDALDDARRQLDRLWRQHESEFGNPDEFVSGGNLTEEGRRRLKRMFEQGKRGTEIAALLGISDSAVAYHRKRWRQLEGARAIR